MAGPGFARWIGLAAAITAGIGCGRSHNTPWLVDALRILAVRAEPPEGSPGDDVTLDALVADPAGAGRSLDHLWAICAPPLSTPGNPCTQLTMGAPTGGTLPPPCSSASGAPLCLAGAGVTASYTLSAASLAGGQPGQPNQITVLLVVSALPGGVAECLRDWASQGAPPSPDCQVATKQVTVSTLPPSLRNHNPTLTDLTLDGTAVPASGATVAPGSTHKLSATYPPGDIEPEPAPGADGGTGGMETLSFAWYTTAGTLSGAVSGTNNLGNDFTAPSSGSEAGGATGVGVPVWIVVRDDRGGIGWIERPLFVGGPAPDGGVFPDATPADSPPGGDVHGG